MNELDRILDKDPQQWTDEDRATVQAATAPLRHKSPKADDRQRAQLCARSVCALLLAL